MHEFHLMTQVVKAVETELQEVARAKSIVVRVKIRASSHLLAQEPSILHTAFALAAQGTKAAGATLEIIPLSGDAWCPRCKMDLAARGAEGVCPACGGLILSGPDAPEMVVHELVLEE
jgi:Zn finger protein HypA/HybF involved in hydrogenase expression